MVDDLKLFQTVTGINLGSNQPSAEQLYWVKPKHELVLLAKTITAKLLHEKSWKIGCLVFMYYNYMDIFNVSSTRFFQILLEKKKSPLTVTHPVSHAI